MRNMSGLKRGGQPGRVPGVPNKTTTEVKALCRSLLNDPVYLAGFVERLRSGQLPPVLEQMTWHFAYGRPPASVEVVSGQVTLAELIVGTVVADTGADDDEFDFGVRSG